MPKKLPLPDYSHVHTVWGDSITRDKVEELAARFSFKPEYDLYEEMNDAASWLDMFHPASGAQREKERQAEAQGIKGYRAGVGDAPPKVRREELQELQKRGKDFLESLRKLGHHASVDLAMNDPKVPQGRVDLDKLALDVQILLWATRKALEAWPDKEASMKEWARSKGLSGSAAGRPDNGIESVFAACIRKIYREGTSKDDKPKHDRTGVYSGDFFEFFRECMKALKLYKSDRVYYRLACDACKTDKVGPKIEE